MDPFFLGFIIVLGTTFASQAINQKATAKLEQEKKAELVDLFSKYRLYHFGIFFAIIIVYIVCIQMELFDRFILNGAYLVSVITFLIGYSVISYNRLKEFNFPDFYIKSYLLSTSVRFVGLMIFFIVLEF